MLFKARHIAIILLLCFLSVTGSAQTSNPIVLENQQPGTNRWMLQLPGFFRADDVNKQIKGYASATSVNKGGSITFYATVTPAQTYTIDIYRMGYYQGLGGRLMQHIGPNAGIQQPACPTDATTGMIACAWSPGASITIPTTWTTGVYLAFLTNAAGFQNYVPFVVRDDASHSALLYQQSVNTAQAYNNYPNDSLTGKSLYDFSSNGAATAAGSKRAVKVSFDRPYSNAGDGDFLSWEVYTVQWMEQNGYDVSYSTDVDTHANGAALLNHKALLAVGHSEYWSKPMRTAVETARDAGINLAFISADSVDWQVRFEPSPATAAANRVMVCYKSKTVDPVQGPTTTVEWSDPFINLPEQPLVGVMFAAQNVAGFADPPASYVVANANNWVYAGTGVANGTAIPLIVGYEVDGFNSAFPSPLANPGTYTLLSNSPTIDVNNGNAPVVGNSSVYQAPSGAWVFATASMDWSWGLSRPGFADARVQAITANVLNRFVGTTRPTVLSQTPAPGAAGVAYATDVVVTFSRAMKASTFSTSTFTLRAAGTSSNVPGAVTVSGANAMLNPNANLAAGTTYTVTVSGTVTDPNGVALGTAASWTFTTAPAGRPAIVSRTPSSNAYNVNSNSKVTITFDRPMKLSTLNSSNIKILSWEEFFEGDGLVVPASISVSGSTVTLTPTPKLETWTNYIVLVSGAVADNNGTSLGGWSVWSFNTGGN